MKNFMFAKNYNPNEMEIAIEERNNLTFNMKNHAYDALEPVITFIGLNYETIVVYHGLMSINDIVQSIEQNITSKTTRVDVDIHYNDYTGDRIDVNRLYRTLIERFGNI